VVFGTDTLRSPSSSSLFLAKYDTGGNILWAMQGYDLVSATGFMAQKLAYGSNNHVFITLCLASDSARFANQLIKSPTKDAACLFELDTSGSYTCGSILINGANGELGVASDPLGVYVYMGGRMTDTTICGPDTLIPQSGAYDPYVTRWTCGSSNEGINNLQANNSGVVLYPNPNNGFFQLGIRNYELGDEEIVEIYNMLGDKVYSKTVNIQHSEFNIDLSSQSNGIYLYRVLNENGNLAGEGKFIIQR
ncbi:MAG TPA: T9SS type A sorting domain-containing protein, partial [Bacteroidia bacterium]|nr:T9SS type A sorting domain-containing protein [Bacteroidia bacterium]